jgi:hypothetical protein
MMINQRNNYPRLYVFASREILISFFQFIFRGSILRECQNQPNHRVRETELTVFTLEMLLVGKVCRLPNEWIP